MDQVGIARSRLLNSLSEYLPSAHISDRDPCPANVFSDHLGIAGHRANHYLGFFCV